MYIYVYFMYMMTEGFDVFLVNNVYKLIMYTMPLQFSKRFISCCRSRDRNWNVCMQIFLSFFWNLEILLLSILVYFWEILMLLKLYQCFVIIKNNWCIRKYKNSVYYDYVTLWVNFFFMFKITKKLYSLIWCI